MTLTARGDRLAAACYGDRGLFGAVEAPVTVPSRGHGLRERDHLDLMLPGGNTRSTSWIYLDPLGRV